MRRWQCRPHGRAWLWFAVRWLLQCRAGAQLFWRIADRWRFEITIERHHTRRVHEHRHTTLGGAQQVDSVGPCRTGEDLLVALVFLAGGCGAVGGLGRHDHRRALTDAGAVGHLVRQRVVTVDAQLTLWHVDGHGVLSTGGLDTVCIGACASLTLRKSVGRLQIGQTTCGARIHLAARAGGPVVGRRGRRTSPRQAGQRVFTGAVGHILVDNEGPAVAHVGSAARAGLHRSVWLVGRCAGGFQVGSYRTAGGRAGSNLGGTRGVGVTGNLDTTVGGIGALCQATADWRCAVRRNRDVLGTRSRGASALTGVGAFTSDPTVGGRRGLWSAVRRSRVATISGGAGLALRGIGHAGGRVDGFDPGDG